MENHHRSSSGVGANWATGVGYELQVIGVRKVFRPEDGRAPLVALERFDLAIEKGEFVCILGPSGCGKSTLLNIVAGFLVPTEGQVILDGVEVTGSGRDRGVVFQEHALFPWFRVWQNVEFGPKMAGVNPAERARIADRYLDLVGLGAFRAAFPKELSGGMKQRVAIARALANDPKILLMDEPFGSLDAQTRRLMQDELTKIWTATGKTILFVTHSIEESLLLADRVVVMTARPGRIKTVLPAPLTRPRSDVAPDFVALKAELQGLLKDEIEAGGEARPTTGNNPGRQTL
ncbi:MAG: ABC transporter ATP-binding protein [Candidatus Rokubacteria bacterium]|nr:ABC transporter ATP-binding protein [Candidatus Rokubacteria bacterium]